MCSTKVFRGRIFFTAKPLNRWRNHLGQCHAIEYCNCIFVRERRRGQEKGKGTGNWIFLRETITVDCAIYRLPLRSICKGKGKGGGKKEKNTGKGKGERKRGKGMRKGTGKGERGNGKRRKGKGKGKA